MLFELPRQPRLREVVDFSFQEGIHGKAAGAILVLESNYSGWCPMMHVHEQCLYCYARSVWPYCKAVKRKSFEGHEEKLGTQMYSPIIGFILIVINQKMMKIIINSYQFYVTAIE
jgi:hypothetical protein